MQRTIADELPLLPPRLAVDLVRGHTHRCRRRLRPWCWPRRRPVSRISRFAWWGCREFRFGMRSPEAELTELFEVFSSINEAWEARDKRAVSTVLINTVDTVSKRVFTWGSSSRNHAPNDCHSLANRSFSGSRSARWRCWGQRAAGRPRFPWLGQWSRVDNRRALGTLRGLVSNRAWPLRSRRATRAHCRESTT